MPAYPHPPQRHAPPPLRVRTRRALGRGLAAAWTRRVGSAGAGPRQRVLLIRPDHLGDLLFLGPALRLLRAQLPDVHFTLAIGPWARPALPGLSGCYDELLEIPFPAFERAGRAGWAARWALLPRLARQLRSQAFDAALLFRPDHWWGAMLTALAHIPQRLGYETPETTPWLSRALALPHEHAAASNLRLAGALLGSTPALDPGAHPLQFALSASARAEAQALLAAQGLSGQEPLVVIHPGAGAPVKLWEIEKWAEVARRLGARGARLLLTGGPAEAGLTAALRRAAGAVAIDLGGKTRFDVLAALLAEADVVLGPDSGPLHLAVAVGTPTVHLFGPADAVRFGPWGDPARHIVLRSAWSCIPCERLDWPDPLAHGCVRDIAPDQVVQAAERLLAMRARS